MEFIIILIVYCSLGAALSLPVGLLSLMPVLRQTSFCLLTPNTSVEPEVMWISFPGMLVHPVPTLLASPPYVPSRNQMSSLELTPHTPDGPTEICVKDPSTLCHPVPAGLSLLMPVLIQICGSNVPSVTVACHSSANVALNLHYPLC